MKKIFQPLLLGIWLIAFSRFACAEIAPKEYERVTNELGRAMELYRGLAKSDIAVDETLPRRDPLRALVDSEGHSVSSADLYDGPILQGIVHSEGFVRVLIDDKFYAVGDSFGPYTVREIRDDGIELGQGNSSLFIPLYPESQRKQGIS